MTQVKYTQEDLVNHHGIAAVIKNEKGDILVQEHVKYGFWTIPVGKIKQGQSIEAGLKEELFDECDIRIEQWKEIATRIYHYTRDGKGITVKGHVFEIITYSGSIKNKEPEKHKTQLFMNIEKIKKLPFLSDLTVLYLETQYPSFSLS